MLGLREIVEGDVDSMMEWATDEEVTRFLSWDAHKSKDSALDFIRNFAMPHPWFRVICFNGVPIGSITLTQGTGIQSCKAELGYVLARKYWSRGIMTRAVRMAVECGFAEIGGLVRIEAVVFKENIASQRVLYKAGFHNTGLQHSYLVVKGLLRDCFIFEFVRSSDDQLMVNVESLHSQLKGLVI